MRIAFWVIANFALLLALLHLVSALRVRSAYRPLESVAPSERPPMSVIALMTTRRPGHEERFDTLVAAVRRDDQLVLVTDGERGALRALVQSRQPASTAPDVVVVDQGAVANGRAQPFTAALPHLNHALVACVDDGVEIASTNLDEAARLVNPTTVGASGTGAVFAFGHYGAPSSVGSAVLAAHTNATLIPHLAALALRGTPRFLVGGFWVTTRTRLEAALARASGSAHTRPTVALGHALRDGGQRLRPLRRLVHWAPEPLDLARGAHRVLDDVVRLRAQGVELYLALTLGWNPLGIAALAALLGFATAAAPPSTVANVFGLTALARAATVLVLNRGFYRVAPPWRLLGTTLLHEALLAPWLYLVGLWRGGRRGR